MQYAHIMQKFYLNVFSKAFLYFIFFCKSLLANKLKRSSSLSKPVLLLKYFAKLLEFIIQCHRNKNGNLVEPMKVYSVNINMEKME